MWRPWETENSKPQRNYLPVKAKEVVLKVYESIKETNGSAGSITQTARTTKVPYATVHRIIKKGVCLRKKRKDSGTQRTFKPNDEKLIRRFIYSFYAENKVCTVDDLLLEIKTQMNKKCSRRSLHILLKKIGFKYKTLNKRQVIIQSRLITEWRYNYLKAIEEYRRQNMPIVYLDETWYDTHDTISKGWVDNSRRCVLNVPPNRGKRIILLHAGTQDGFINNALLLSAKNIKHAKLDYHEDMTAELFEKWFADTLLPNIPPNSVIVLDNASYHSRQLKKVPTKSSRKEEIMDFLYENDLYFESSYTKTQLLEVLKIKTFRKRFVIDELAAQHGHKVLRLPPYHCKYNPIEMIWSELKNKVRKNNTYPKYSEQVINIIKQVIMEIPTDSWANTVRHVIKIEEEDRKLLVPECIINLGEDSDSSYDEMDK